MRIAIFGNAGAGKSTLARAVANRTGLPHVEIDQYLWHEGWTPAPEVEFNRMHDKLIAEPAWLIDGMGRWQSIRNRSARATLNVLVDLPFPVLETRLRARQSAWLSGNLEFPPGGQKAPPDTGRLIDFARDIDRDWMADLRSVLSNAKAPLKHLRQEAEVAAFLASFTETSPSKEQGPP